VSRRKWLREQKAKDDNKQATLNPTTSTGVQLKQPPKPVEFATIDYPVMCPFCLHIGKINEFLINTTHGYHRGLGKCPECKNGMRLSTLTVEWTPEQYAEFAYPYSTDGFWQKVPFEKWKERLHKIGWAHRFWTRYKQLKGEGEEERETIITKQERMRRECPRCGEVNPEGTTFCNYCKTRLIESYG